MRCRVTWASHAIYFDGCQASEAGKPKHLLSRPILGNAADPLTSSRKSIRASIVSPPGRHHLVIRTEMRLINAEGLELVGGANPYLSDIPPYAILSHTWGHDEDVFVTYLCQVGF